MDSNLTQFTPREGMNVYGSDGDKVGEVDAVEADYFVVRKGFFFPEDHYIPRNAVANFDEDNIYLSYTKDEVLSQNWTTAPEAGAWDTTTLAGTQVGDRSADLDAVDTTAGPGSDADIDTTAAYGTGVATDTDHVSVPVHEEELVARKRAVDRGAVQVNKDVVAEEQSIDVPVTEERVEVTRRNVDRDVTPSDDAFREGTIEVPVSGEEVDVEKRTRVTGEVDIDKTAEQHTKRVTDTVRREEVTVDDDVVDAVDDVNNPRQR
jgi:uncharacterized protein (TIGR02271 family)